MSLPSVHDVEKNEGHYAHLTNTAVSSFCWEDVSVTVKDRQTKAPKTLVSDVSGALAAGEMLALMGPSGSGKTTLLNVLARRDAHLKATIKQSLYVNGRSTSLSEFRKISSYVEQEDALIGSLTVRETLYFAAKLALPKTVSKTDRIARIESLLAAFGLQRQSETLIGTPIRKGLSGGQKRRISVASQLITSPKVLFLDEPTSGLDSAASYEVMSFVRNIAKKHKLLVIASIHQPSTTTFQLFDKLLLLSEGRTVYNGPINTMKAYFDSNGYEMPMYMNPAEYVLDLVNTDFTSNRVQAEANIKRLHDVYAGSQAAVAVGQAIAVEKTSTAQRHASLDMYDDTAGQVTVLLALIHRSFLKSYRDVIAYGIRIVMYMGLAVMMGTVWLRMGQTQDNIQSFINAIFFGGAFMSFMAVAYIPAYLEDRSMYIKDRANGLYGPTAFMISNFLTGLPYLFLIAILFSIVSYWLSNFRPSASGFFYWVMWLLLDLIAAESLVVLISSLVPIFVVALAAVAFANGLWMCVNGFLVPLPTLNVFWKYVFSYIDYQRWVFQGMMVNEFANRVYACGEGCHCMYETDLADQCLIDGKGVLDFYGYKTGKFGEWVGILLAIIVVYRIFGWVVLYMKRT